MPVLDTHDSKSKLLYTSLNQSIQDNNNNDDGDDDDGDDDDWCDEEGFYKINTTLHEDFCIICRFGGVYASDINDKTKNYLDMLIILDLLQRLVHRMNYLNVILIL